MALVGGRTHKDAGLLARHTWLPNGYALRSACGGVEAVPSVAERNVADLELIPCRVCGTSAPAPAGQMDLFMGEVK